MPAPRRLLYLLAVPAVTLAACGGSSDEDKVTKIIKDVNSDPASVCDHLDDAALKQLGGKAGCVKAAKSAPRDASTKVDDVSVDGDTATVKITDKTGASSVTLKKVDGDWKVTTSQ